MAEEAGSEGSESAPTTNRERVRIWFRDHPDATLKACSDGLGINIGTVSHLRKKPADPDEAPLSPEEVRAAIGKKVARDVAKLTVDRVTKEALQTREWDIDAGEWLRHFWRGSGLTSIFPTPRALVEEAVPKWFQWRDEVNEFEKKLVARDLEIQRLRVQLTPAYKAQYALNIVTQASIIAAMSGHPLSSEVALALLQGAKELGLG